jgi:hypothetical protein
VGAATLLGVTMEEKGITKTIAIRLQNAPALTAPDLDDKDADDSPYADFEEETVPPEEGRELPQGVDDPAAVTDADLHPLRHQTN